MLGICIYTVMLGLEGHNIDCIYMDKWALRGHFLSYVDSCGRCIILRQVAMKLHRLYFG